MCEGESGGSGGGGNGRSGKQRDGSRTRVDSLVVASLPQAEIRASESERECVSDR